MSSIYCKQWKKMTTSRLGCSTDSSMSAWLSWSNIWASCIRPCMIACRTCCLVVNRSACPSLLHGTLHCVHYCRRWAYMCIVVIRYIPLRVLSTPLTTHTCLSRLDRLYTGTVLVWCVGWQKVVTRLHVGWTIKSIAAAQEIDCCSLCVLPRV